MKVVRQPVELLRIRQQSAVAVLSRVFHIIFTVQQSAGHDLRGAVAWFRFQHIGINVPLQALIGKHRESFVCI